jgi:molybdopterin-guanine dinucleotide biosynthesis protein A
VYRKKTVQVFAKQIAAGNLRMSAAIKLLNFCYVKLQDTPFPDYYLTNINTPDEYAELLTAIR